jgi:predicted ester cyclase
MPPVSNAERSKAVVLGFFEDVANKHRAELIGHYCAENYVMHWDNPAEDVHGLAAFREGLSGMLAAFPDFSTDIEDVIVEGDRVVVRYEEGGTLTHDFMGVKAQGQRVRWPAIVIMRVEDDKIAEEWFQGPVRDRLAAAAAEGN